MVKKIETPFTEQKIRELSVGDMVLLTGTIYTGRDAVHKYLFEGNKPPVDLSNQIIYHCGPVIIKEGGKWVAKAAGPTTSSREEPYEWKLIEKFKLRGIIGKGGMGEKTLEACKKFGCCYMHAIGGAAQVLAEKIINVKNVYLLEELGQPEAIWEFEVGDFPVVITMDSHGESLHETIFKSSEEALKKVLAKKLL